MPIEPEPKASHPAPELEPEEATTRFVRGRSAREHSALFRMGRFAVTQVVAPGMVLGPKTTTNTCQNLFGSPIDSVNPRNL